MDLKKAKRLWEQLSLHDDLLLYKEKHGKEFCALNRIKASDLDMIISIIHVDRMKRNKSKQNIRKTDPQKILTSH